MIVHSAPGHLVASLEGGAAQVREYDTVVQPQQRMVARQRLRIGYVHGGAGDQVALQGVKQAS